MNRNLSKIAFVGCAIMAMSPASAAVMVGVPIIVADTGNVTATFVSTSASFTSELGLVGRPGVIFNTSTTATGTVVDLGSFAAGTVLKFSLRVLNTGQTYFTGPGTDNPDGVPHAGVDMVAGGTTVGFEDTFGGGDQDYNDLIFSFTNTRAAVPEPATWAMMLGGFGLVGAAARRRARPSVAFA